MKKGKVFLSLWLAIAVMAGCRENRPNLKIQQTSDHVSTDEEKVVDLGPNASIVTQKTDISEDERTGANTSEGRDVTAVKVEY